MAEFENYLLAEFSEQHNNSREIEKSSYNRIQFLFTLEGVLIGGTLSLVSAIELGPEFFSLLFIPFWFLFAFGHFVYLGSIRSIRNMLVLDFSNTLVRLYFAEKYPEDSKYIYFLPEVKKLLERKGRNWEFNRDNSVYIAKFAGLINTANFMISLILTIYSVTFITDNTDIFPQLDFIFIGGIFLGLAVAMTWLYDRIFFVRIIRKEEMSVIAEQREKLLKFIDDNGDKNYNNQNS